MNKDTDQILQPDKGIDNPTYGAIESPIGTSFSDCNMDMSSHISESALTTIPSTKEDPLFTSTIHSVLEALDADVKPELILKGSSGAYLIRSRQGTIVGVFKPKDEEPYGQLNPKWTKWIHKHCCPCCFGRSCLVPNQGYLSEAGASVVDEMLGLGIVPKTRVVRLASETFNYNSIDRAKSRSKQHLANNFPSVARRFHRIGLPPKVGSFQLFMHNFKDADYWLRKFETEPLPEPVMKEFQLLFEKLVVLDYVIRNTDRGNDNWLIRYEKPPPKPPQTTPIEGDSNSLTDQTEATQSPSSSKAPASSSPPLPVLQIAAIDNGLAFPYKHPDEWRTYPFQWSRLQMAEKPFSEEIKTLVQDKLNSPEFVESLRQELYELFKNDKGFDEKTFECQMAVMRGQILNLRAAMRDNKSPAQLVDMRVATIERQRMSFPSSTAQHHPHNNQKMGPSTRHEIYEAGVEVQDHHYVSKYWRRAFFRWF